VAGRRPRVLHADRLDAGTRQRAAQQCQGLGVPGRDERGGRQRRYATRSAQVRGESGTKRRVAALVAIAEDVVPSVPRDAQRGARPFVPREQPDVGHARPEVELDLGRRDVDRHHRLFARYALRDVRAGPHARHEVALGEQLRVRLHDSRSGHAELGRESARRRQPVAAVQAAAADRSTKLRLQRTHHVPSPAVETQEQIRDHARGAARRLGPP
jgi:hypothetical protein